MAAMTMVMPESAHPQPPVPAARAAALAASIAPGSATAATPGSAAARSVHHLTLVLVATDGAAPDFTRTQALAGIAELRDFYRREMHGAIALQVDAVFTWQRVTFPCSDYARTFTYAANRVAWTPGPRKHLVIMLPTTVDCGYGGIAGEGATVDSGENMITVGPSLGYTAHEFGHNISLFHTGTLTCSTGSDGTWSGQAWSNGCRTEEYGDRYDVMGAPYYNFDFNAASFARLNSLPNAYAMPAGATRQVRIAPVSGAFTARRAVTWTTSAGVRYWIEARSVTGNAVFEPHPEPDSPDFPNGVRIIRTDPSEDGHNLVLSRPGDTSETSQDFRVGDVISLADGTQIKVLALDASGATVRVVRG